jgi:hypothetical protein
MDAELQRLVDGVAERTGRPVVLEDRRQRMIVYSQHDEPIDQVRSESILSRRTRPEVVAWLRSHGIATATGPVRTPAREELGLLARVCVPIRHQELLLGFLWFVDPDASLTDDQLRAVASTLDRFSLALYRENLAGELASNRVAEAMRNLLATEPEVPVHAAQELIADGRFPQDAPVVALVARPVLADGTEPDEYLRLAIEQALLAVRRGAGGHVALHLVRFDHGALLVATDDAVTSRSPIGVALHLRQELERACHGLTGVERVLVGLGVPRDELAEVRGSYEEARQAAEVAVHLPVPGPVAEWSRLGVYRALAHLSDEQMEATTLHPGLERLLADDKAAPLVDTLETYLDLAGSAQATAEALSLHRTTLYHRLGRIEQLCETDLRDGDERLALHLGLKLARLTGRR